MCSHFLPARLLLDTPQTSARCSHQPRVRELLGVSIYSHEYSENRKISLFLLISPLENCRLIISQVKQTEIRFQMRVPGLLWSKEVSVLYQLVDSILDPKEKRRLYSCGPRTEKDRLESRKFDSAKAARFVAGGSWDFQNGRSLITRRMFF
jgi:hypothetical protein